MVGGLSLSYRSGRGEVRAPTTLISSIVEVGAPDRPHLTSPIAMGEELTCEGRGTDRLAEVPTYRFIRCERVLQIVLPLL